MPRNGSGTYSRVPGSAYANDTTADGPEVDAEMNDIATALTNSVARSGESPMTGPLNMGGNGITNLGAMSVSGALSADYFRGDSASAATPAFSFQGDTSSGFYQSQGTYTISFSTNSTHAGTISSAQNWGIGEASPQAKLHVKGLVRIDNALPSLSFYNGGTLLGRITAGSAPDQIAIEPSGTNGDIVLKIGAADALKVVGNGSFGASTLLGAPPVALNDTSGYAYVRAASGIPTGIPQSNTGFAAMKIDTLNNRLYFYVSGAWRYASLT